MSERQHFLPASYIGRFSLENTGRWRKRPVWVQRVGGAPFEASAEYVAHADRIYDREKSSEWDGASIDAGWTYEARLPEAINALDNRSPLDAHLWAEVLVPFVSSLFIRGVDFASRFESRMPGVTGPTTDPLDEPVLDSWRDNTIAARQIEWQRLLAPVMSAEWTVVHGSGQPILITNDVAHCLMTKADGAPDDISYAFPISPSSVLVLERRVVRRILDWDGGRWTAPINHIDTTDDDLRGCRRAIQESAIQEVYGPTKAAVMFPSSDFKPSVPPLDPAFLIPHEQARALLPYLYDYFKVLSLLDSAPTEFAEKSEHIDPTIVARVWTAPIQMLLDVAAFPGGLALTPYAAYLDIGRFTSEEIESAIGIEAQALPPAPVRPRPELLQLMEADLRSVGVDLDGIEIT